MGRITGPDTIKMSRATSRHSNKSHITRLSLACYQIQAPEDWDVLCFACYREGELEIFLRNSEILAGSDLSDIECIYT